MWARVFDGVKIEPVYVSCFSLILACTDDVCSGSLAARLQLNVDVLEQQLAERLDDAWLRQIGVLDPSAKHVDMTPISAVDVERRAKSRWNTLLHRVSLNT